MLESKKILHLIVSAVAAGILRVITVDPKMRGDMVPVDMAVNSLICAAWEIGKKGEKQIKFENSEKQPIQP